MKNLLVRLLSGSMLFALTTSAADWPNFRGLDHNGISTETGWSAQWPATGPKKLWTAKVGTGFSSIAVSGGRAYVLGNAKDTNTLFCFDAASGTPVWNFSYKEKLDPKFYEGGPSATPTVADGRVYIFSKAGRADCLDAASGKELWSKNLPTELKAKTPTWGFASSGFITDDLVLFNFGSAGTALDRKTGKIIWTSGGDEAGYSTAVPFKSGADSAVMFAIKEHVVALRPKDGKELWRFPWKTEYDVNAADPVAAGSKVFISSGYGHGCGLFDVSAQPPTKIWENKNIRNHFNSCVLWQGHLYGVDESELRCINLETGSVKWSDKVSGKGSLILADGKLIVLSERGELLVAPATPEGFKPAARAQVLGGKCWSSPALANGRIYCRNNVAGDVVCLDVSGK